MTMASTQPRSMARWLSIPLLIAFAACGGGSKSASQSTKLVAVSIKSFAIVPNTASVPAGTKLPFAARATFVDGTTRDVSADAAWSSANPSLVTFIPGEAVAIATAVGTTTVTATYQGIAASAALEITPGLLLQMSMNPGSATIASGTTQQLSVFAALSDAKQDVTKVATWRSSNAAAAKVDAAGLVTGVGAGTAIITAEFSGGIVLANVTVTSATLQSISIGGAGSSGGVSAVLGVDVPLTVTGGYSDGNTQDLTTQVTWTSSDPSVATVGSDGVVHPVGTGSTVITATRDGVSSSVVVTVTSATLASLAITPATKTLVVGNVFAFQATGTFTDGTTRDMTAQVSWASSNDTVVVMAAGGTATAKSAGSATIAAASADGSVSASASVTVTTAKLVSIAIAPASTTLAAGLTAQLSATGTYDDGTTQPLTALVVWTSSNTDVASVSSRTGSTGVVTATAPGTATITATLAGISGTSAVTVSSAALQSIAVSGPASIAVGSSGAFKASGTYSDGSSQDVSAVVTWSSSNPGVATVSSTGSATGVAVGTANVMAKLGGVSGSASLGVTAVTVQTLAIAPGSKTLAIGDQQQFAATATFSDGSTRIVTTGVTWTTSDGTVASIAAGGLLTAKAVGTATVTAALLGQSSTATVNVTAAVLQSVAVYAPTTNLLVGTSTTLTAKATYSDGSTSDVTAQADWASSSAAATVTKDSTSGVVTLTANAASSSPVTVTATFGGISGTVNVTTSVATLSRIDVAPTNTSSPAGLPVQFTATGVYTSGGQTIRTQDLTTQVVWSSSDATIASVTSGQQGGLVTGVAVGTVTIQATFTDASASQSGATTFTVSDAILQTLEIQGAIKIATGTQTALQLMGYYSDVQNTGAIMTNVIWSSSDATVASIDPSTGVVSGKTAGSVTITAQLALCPATPSPCSDTMKMQIVDATLAGMTVDVQPAVILPVGLNYFVTAAQAFKGSDGTTWIQDVTPFAVWTSSAPAVAQIVPTSVDPVVLNALVPGTSTVTATYNNSSADALLTVIAARLTSVDLTAETMTIGGDGSGLVPVGYSVPVTASATYTAADNTTYTYDVTDYTVWSSSDTSAATVSNAAGTNGLVTGLAPGNVTITGTFDGLTDTVDLEVVNGTLKELTVTDVPFAQLNGTAPQSIQTLGTIGVGGQGKRLYAIGKFTDSSGQDFYVEMTNQCNWRASPRSIVWITNALTSANQRNDGTKGLVTGTSDGSAKVVARRANAFDSATVTVDSSITSQ